MKVYISGKITGLDEIEAKENFEKTELLIDGYPHVTEVVNPMKVQILHSDPSWQDYMIVGIAMLLNCDAIYMQANWRSSKGARIEHSIAHELGLEIWYARGY